MRKKRPLKRVDGVHRAAILIVIASEDRYAVKQYFDLFKSTQIQRANQTRQSSTGSPEILVSSRALPCQTPFVRFQIECRSAEGTA